MGKGLMVLMLAVSAIIMLMILFLIFPMILTGVDTVNGTSNITQYYGLSELTNLSPTLIFVAFVAIILAMFGWIFREPIKRRFFGGDRGE